MVRRVWSDVRYQFGYIEWLSNSFEPLQRNMRLMTKFESVVLLEYLVGTWLVGIDKSKLKELAIIRKPSLIEEWWEKEGFHKLS